MRIHNIYADENGETHFRDIEIELSDAGPDGITSKRFPASGIIFRTTPADWFFDWHPATRRQYVINPPQSYGQRRRNKNYRGW
jgi:hypothetical protein